MKKLFTLLFALGLVAAASAQTGDRYRNHSRSNNNSYQTSPYSKNDHRYSNPYSDRDHQNQNTHWNNQNSYNRYDWDRQRAEQQRYEMIKRKQAKYYNPGRYDKRSTSLRMPILGLLGEIFR